MNDTPITKQDVLDTLREIVAEVGPEHAAPIIGGSCRYELDGEPCCLGGHAAVRLGLANIDILKEWDEGTPSRQSLGIGTALGKPEPWQGKRDGVPGPLRPITDDAITLLVRAQELQDDMPEGSDDDEDMPEFATNWGYVLSKIEDGAQV